MSTSSLGDMRAIAEYDTSVDCGLDARLICVRIVGPGAPEAVCQLRIDDTLELAAQLLAW